MKIEMCVRHKDEIYIKEQNQFIEKLEKFLFEEGFPLISLKVEYEDYQGKDVNALKTCIGHISN